MEVIIPAKILMDGKEYTVTSIADEVFCCEAENGNCYFGEDTDDKKQ